MTKYLLIYHDESNLYEDVLITVVDEVQDGSAYSNYRKHAGDIVNSVYGFVDNDGQWVLTKMINETEIPALYYTA